MNFGEYLKLKREGCGWSLRDLSERSGGTSIGFLSDMEHGKSDPSLETLQRLAKAFDMGAGDMLVQAGYTVNRDMVSSKRTLTITVEVGVLGEVVYVDTRNRETTMSDEQYRTDSEVTR